MGAKVRTPKRLEVTWDDHCTGDPERHRPIRVKSIGYLYHENKKVLQLSPHWDQDGDVWEDEVVTIIKSCIVRREDL